VRRLIFLCAVTIKQNLELRTHRVVMEKLLGCDSYSNKHCLSIRCLPGSVANFWFGRIDPEVVRFRDVKPAGG
jgi:hypothetical protein